MEHRLTIVAAALLLTLSCSPESLFRLGGEQVDTTGNLSHEMIVLGEKLEDPYTVENVAKALLSLYPTRAGRIDVTPTDVYVRFLPCSDGDFEVLEASGVQLYDHPLDYRIVREGDYYHDPEIPDDEITWQYAVVPSDFEFPEGIPYETLDLCYISEHDPVTRSDGIDWEAVEREAYRISGNGDMLEVSTRGNDKTYPAANPKGRISIVDDSIGNSPIGVAGVQVSVNAFVKFANAFTDANGYYEIDRKFTTEVRYRLVFRNRKGFGIGMNLLLCPASTSTLGKHAPDGVSINVTRSSERKLFSRCVVNNALRDYYESCSVRGVSIKTPPSNLRVWIFQNLRTSSAPMFQQGVYIDGGTVGSFLGEYAPLVKLFLPDVTLGLSGKDDYASIYSSALHECAHASHFMQAGRAYWEKYIKFVLTSFVTSGGIAYGVGTEPDHGYCEVGEMWAYYVQTRLFRERYRDQSRSFGTSFWFSPQVFLYLDDRGIDRFRIYPALTSDISGRDLLRSKLLALYPESKSIIAQAFTRYN